MIGVVSLDFAHDRIHRGKSFYFQYSDLDLDLDAQINILLVTSHNELVHIIFDIGVTQVSQVQLYEDVITTVDGEELDSYARNRQESELPPLNVYGEPTISDIGDEFFNAFLVTGSQGANINLLQERSDNEFILKQNTKYLLRLTSKADNNIVMIIADYYCL